VTAGGDGAVPPRIVLKLMFDWGGGCLWCVDAAGRERLGVGNVEDVLPLRDETRTRLDELTAWHDESLDWAYPPDPGPWTEEESARFEAAAEEMLIRLRAELGDAYEIVYRRL
jgi:hypothetical protein